MSWPMTPEELHAWVAASRAAQGLPPEVTDPRILARVRRLLLLPRPEERERRA